MRHRLFIATFAAVLVHAACGSGSGGPSTGIKVGPGDEEDAVARDEPGAPSTAGGDDTSAPSAAAGPTTTTGGGGPTTSVTSSSIASGTGGAGGAGGEGGSPTQQCTATVEPCTGCLQSSCPSALEDCQFDETCCCYINNCINFGDSPLGCNSCGRSAAAIALLQCATNSCSSDCNTGF